MAVNIENEASLRAALSRDSNLFVGAGFSTLAKDKSNRPIPTGAQLVEELCVEFKRPELSGQQLPLVSQILKSLDRSRFNDYLTNRFKVNELDDRYYSILDLGISRIFTTNIDNLFNVVFDVAEGKYLNDLIMQGASHRDRAAVEYLPLHGSIVYPDPDFTFTPIEIASAFSDNPTQFQYLVSSISKCPTIFLGYSLQDAGTLQSLNSTFSDPTQDKPRWIQLRAEDEAARTYFGSLGFNIILGETDDLLDYLTQIATSKGPSAKSTPQILKQSDFHSGKIPTLHETAVRPINDFFRGHAPVWHDILARRIPQLSHYSRIVNHIDAGRNTLITGLPVCGKSTLLMQLAAYCDFDGVKLFEGAITPEKASSIRRTAEGKGRVLLFLDNAGDSVDSLDLLASSPAIQVVAADRSVNIGFASHRFDVRNFISHDCSELAEMDFSKVFEAIPPAIRESRMKAPAMEADNRPSTFEFIEGNVVGQKISDRYREVLRKLKAEQTDIHDLFVMICYVSSCHAPVSFDVVSRFTRSGGDYHKVYSLTGRLGKLLSEINTESDEFLDLDDSQDHFTPRSALIAETVIQMCRNDDFSRVYLQFHDNVPRLFIPRYPTFRRYGYRSGLVERVFQNWELGEKFYLRAYKEDRSYFLKQQLAIFLGAKKRFELAFKYIDEALSESKNRNPNIRHTHARLLFDANIEKAAEDASLRGHLTQSMQILEACHEYDKRQTNHAIRFAEQSIRFYSIFPGGEAEGYLEKARTWLVEEVAKLPSLRYAKVLLKKLREM